jgi:hypothetical protein
MADAARAAQRAAGDAAFAAWTQEQKAAAAAASAAGRDEDGGGGGRVRAGAGDDDFPEAVRAALRQRQPLWRDRPNI